MSRFKETQHKATTKTAPRWIANTSSHGSAKQMKCSGSGSDCFLFRQINLIVDFFLN